MTSHDDNRFQRLLSKIKKSDLNLDDYATDGFDAVLAHVDGVFVGANQKAIDIGGYDGIDDIIGKNALTFIDKDSFANVLEKITKHDLGPYKAVLLSRNGKRLNTLLRVHEISVGNELVRIVAGKLVP